MLRFCNNFVIFIYIRLQTKLNITHEALTMYTTDDRGILNNYAVEPAMSYAEYPSEVEQKRYALQGAIAVLLVSSLLLTALAVS